MDDQVLDGIRRMVDKLSDKIVDLEEQLDRYKWISVNDRLPDKQGQYIVYEPHHPYKVRMIGWMGTWVFNGCKENGVTHWMPLPEPPVNVR